jgi:hypothetical protein
VQTFADNKFLPDSARVSVDGEHVYVVDQIFSRLRTFRRDVSTGMLDQVRKDRIDPALASLEPSLDGAHLYAGGTRVDTYAVDASTGLPTLLDRLSISECHDVGFVGDVRSASFLSDGRLLAHLGFVASVDVKHGVATFGRDPATGALSLLEIAFAEDGDLAPLTEVTDLSISSDDAHAYTIGRDDDSIAAFAIGASPPPSGRDCRLPGKSLVIRNSGSAGSLVSIKWSSRDEPPTGIETTEEDPRCNGDPPGTVRATLRFSSSTSGADTGEIPLPCENWQIKGGEGTPQRRYSYTDKERDEGPCRKVDVKGLRALTASCDGRGPSPLDYMLGVDQGSVDAVLAIGALRYCASFEGLDGADGSDGRKFRAKNAPAPAGCP